MTRGTALSTAGTEPSPHLAASPAQSPPARQTGAGQKSRRRRCNAHRYLPSVLSVLSVVRFSRESLTLRQGVLTTDGTDDTDNTTLATAETALQISPIRDIRAIRGSAGKLRTTEYTESTEEEGAGAIHRERNRVCDRRKPHSGTGTARSSGGTVPCPRVGTAGPDCS
jgi:hypothetical protein